MSLARKVWTIIRFLQRINDWFEIACIQEEPPELLEFHRWAMKFQLLLHPPFGTSFLRKPPTRPCPTRSGWAVLNISVYKDSS